MDGEGTTRHFGGIGEGPMILRRDIGGTTRHFGRMEKGPPDTSEGCRRDH